MFDASLVNGKKSLGVVLNQGDGEAESVDGSRSSIGSITPGGNPREISELTEAGVQWGFSIPSREDDVYRQVPDSEADDRVYDRKYRLVTVRTFIGSTYQMRVPYSSGSSEAADSFDMPALDYDSEDENA